MPKTKKEMPKKIAPAKAIKKLAPALKPMAKSAKKAEPKVKLQILPTAKKDSQKEISKGDHKSTKLEIKTVEILSVQMSEEDEEIEIQSTQGTSQSGLAMAAASATAETASGSLKNFRHHPDIENYYRFIYENDLRYEALEIIDRMSTEGLMHKTSKAARARAN